MCNSKLKCIDFPVQCIQCSNNICDDINHREIINNLYCDMVSVLSEAAILTCKHVNRPYVKKPQVTGWNKHVRGAHRQARLDFHNWIWYGKPKNGEIYNKMCQSRKIFKSKLKWCIDNKEQIKMDIIALHPFIKIKSLKSFGKKRQSVIQSLSTCEHQRGK